MAVLSVLKSSCLSMQNQLVVADSSLLQYCCICTAADLVGCSVSSSVVERGVYYCVLTVSIQLLSC